jgi:multidrug efflux pump subunit AcrA (membrane-fusion protein)
MSNEKNRRLGEIRSLLVSEGDDVKENRRLFYLVIGG